MKNAGMALVVVAIAVVLVLMLGGLLFFMARPSGGTAAVGGAPGAKIGYSASVSRSPGGVTVLLAVTNAGVEDLRDLRLLWADIANLKAGTVFPLKIGSLPRGATRTLTLPYSGPVAEGGGPLQIKIQAAFAFGLFGNGSSGSSLTMTLPPSAK